MVMLCHVSPPFLLCKPAQMYDVFQANHNKRPSMAKGHCCLKATKMSASDINVFFLLLTMKIAAWLLLGPQSTL